MNRTAYGAGLCRTIYDDLTLHSLPFTLKTALVKNLHDDCFTVRFS